VTGGGEGPDEKKKRKDEKNSRGAFMGAGQKGEKI